MSQKTNSEPASVKENGIRKFTNRISTVIQRFLSFLFNEQKLTRERKTIVLDSLKESSSPGVDFFILILLSCMIATLGLLTNSAAVIIGAMLIAPLMSPILGLAMASINGLSKFFRQSLLAILEGAALAVALSAVIAFVAYRLPFGILAAIPSEVWSRTSPSPIDLGIGLAGGAAAAYALAHPRLSAALPGVAISTALMPPLCTVGIGIAFTNSTIIFGAFLLFLTNLIAISFAGIITFAVMGFGPRNLDESEHISRSFSISSALVLIVGLLLAILAWNTILEARFYSQASSAIIESTNQYTTASLVDLKISSEAGTKNLVVTLRTNRNLSHAEAVALQDELSRKLKGPIGLELITIPMEILDPKNTPTPTPTITQTPVISPTATQTPSPSPTATITPQPSPTPAPAFISYGRQKGADIFAQPNEDMIFHLPENSAGWVMLQTRQTSDAADWVEIRDIFGRTGWVKINLLDITQP